MIITKQMKDYMLSTIVSVQKNSEKVANKAVILHTKRIHTSWTIALISAPVMRSGRATSDNRVKENGTNNIFTEKKITEKDLSKVLTMDKILSSFIAILNSK